MEKISPAMRTVSRIPETPPDFESNTSKIASARALLRSSASAALMRVTVTGTVTF